MELERWGTPEAVRKDGNFGMAMLFDTEGRGLRWSSAATEALKTIGVKKSTLSEKTGRLGDTNQPCISWCIQGVRHKNSFLIHTDYFTLTGPFLGFGEK